MDLLYLVIVQPQFFKLNQLIQCADWDFSNLVAAQTKNSQVGKLKPRYFADLVAIQVQCSKFEACEAAGRNFLNFVATQIKILQLLEMVELFNSFYFIVKQLQFLDFKGLLELI